MNENQFLDSLNNQESSEEIQEENLNLPEEGIQEEDNVADNGAEELLELSPAEQKAFDKGWRPKEEFSGDEANWKSAEHYLQYGELLSQIKERDQRMDRLEAETKERLDNQNKLHELRAKKELAKLKEQQRQSVYDQDTDAYDDTQRQIDELQAQPVNEPVTNQPVQADPLIEQWVTANPWINDENDDRAILAMGALNVFQKSNPNASVQEAITHVESKVNKLFPAQNQRRGQPSTNEQGRRAPASNKRTLTMNDLTNDERQEWQSHGKLMFKTEKAFLQAVKDARVK